MIIVRLVRKSVFHIVRIVPGKDQSKLLLGVMINK